MWTIHYKDDLWSIREAKVIGISEINEGFISFVTDENKELKIHVNKLISGGIEYPEC